MGCSSKIEYSVEVKNRTTSTLEAITISWRDNYSVRLGNIYPGSGAGEAFITAPTEKTILSYHLAEREVKKVIEIMGKIPKNQSGMIIIYIRENDVIDIEFKNDK